MLDLLIPTVAQGLLWALMALGVYITFRVQARFRWEQR